MNELTRFTDYLRITLGSRGVPFGGPSESFLVDAQRWRIGPPGRGAHFIVVSEEAITFGLDLVAATQRLAAAFNWPGTITEHAGKAYVIRSDGSIHVSSVDNFPA